MAALRKGESDSPQKFIASIAKATGKNRTTLDRLIKWAEWLTSTFPNIRLLTYKSSAPGTFTLRLRIMPDDVSLASIWNNNGQPYLAVRWPRVEHLAPKSIAPVECATGRTMGRGTTRHTEVTDELIYALTAAYKEANL